MASCFSFISYLHVCSITVITVLWGGLSPHCVGEEMETWGAGDIGSQCLNRDFRRRVRTVCKLPSFLIDAILPAYTPPSIFLVPISLHHLPGKIPALVRWPLLPTHASPGQLHRLERNTDRAASLALRLWLTEPSGPTVLPGNPTVPRFGPAFGPVDQRLP